VIAQVYRGDSMPNLVSYLFGPGRHNEHVNQHLVAGYADAVFTADGSLWQNEPGVTRRVPKQARELGLQLDYPRSRWQIDVPRGSVWHCSLSLKAGEGPLTDAQWTQAAYALVRALGFDGADGKAPCRWAAVRHGPSKDGNDHIHVAVSLVREDGTRASTWNDYLKAGKACADLEARFGLARVLGRNAHRSVPEPSRADREISAARGDPEPLRVRLERTVRACAAAARSEAHFVALARSSGLLIRPRYADDPGTWTVTGYAVAAKDGRQAYSRKTGRTGPIWFGGGKLASDLTLPGLRRRWEPPGQNTAAARAEALAAWSAAITLDDLPLPTGDRPHAGQLTGLEDVDPRSAADLLATAAAACEPGAPGPLSQAARHMAKAAQQARPVSRRPEVTAVISDMASTFMAVTQSGTGDVLTLVREVATLIDTVAATTGTTTLAQTTQLVRASLAAMTRAAHEQAIATLPARRSSTKEDTMSEPTHEEEFLQHVTAAGVLTARLVQAAAGQSPGGLADVKALRAAGYTETTGFDGILRQELGEQRWAWYVADPARLVCAAAITDAARAGQDVPALLGKACRRRAWEDDQQSPARSIARVLYYRITQEMTRRTTSAAPHQRTPYAGRTNAGDTPRSRPPARAPMPETRWDDLLKNLLGEQRWGQYATDERRRDVAVRLTEAAADHHDVAALLTTAVNRRQWEDDPTSPSHRVGGVLHYRINGLIASGEFQTRNQNSQLPSPVAQAVSRAAAPAHDGLRPAHNGDAPPRPRTAQTPQPDRERG